MYIEVSLTNKRMLKKNLSEYNILFNKVSEITN